MNCGHRWPVKLKAMMLVDTSRLTCNILNKTNKINKIITLSTGILKIIKVIKILINTKFMFRDHEMSGM